MKRRFAWWVAACLLSGLLVILASSLAYSFLTGWEFHDLYELLRVPTILSFGVVGALVISRRPRHPIGWLFWGVALSGSLQAFLSAYANYAGDVPLQIGERYLVATLDPQLARWAQSLAIFIIGGLSLYWLLLLFPTGKLASRRWLPFAVFVLLITAAEATRIGLMDRPGQDSTGAILGLDLLALRLSILGNSVGIGALVFTLMGIIAASSVVFRYRAAGVEERYQIKWFVLAAVLTGFLLMAGLAIVFTGVSLDNNSLNLLIGITVQLVLTLLPVTTAIAIFKYRLYDIDLIIRRTFTFGSLALFITVGYVAVVVGAGRLLGTGQENIGISLIATGLVAVAFQPVREEAQRLVSRLVYGKQAEPYEVLSRLARQVGNTFFAEDLLAAISEAAAGGVRARAALVRLFLEGGGEVSQGWPPETSVELSAEEGHQTRHDVVHLGQRVGEVLVLKAPDDPMRPLEMELLSDLVSQAAPALYNLRLTEELKERLREIRRQADELEASQRRLMSADLWARLKIERELHERVEMHLVASGDALGTLEPGSHENQAESIRALETAAEEARKALEEIRELGRGVFPALLDEEGIATALRAQIKKAEWRVRLDLEEGFAEKRFDRNSEWAAYFCCVEALKHLSSLEGPPVELQIGTAGEMVSFSIRAGARRFAEVLPEALLQEMADRVEAIGGTLEVRRGTHEGTNVAGSVPLTGEGGQAVDV